MMPDAGRRLRQCRRQQFGPGRGAHSARTQGGTFLLSTNWMRPWGGVRDQRGGIRQNSPVKSFHVARIINPSSNHPACGPFLRASVARWAPYRYSSAKEDDVPAVGDRKDGQQVEIPVDAEMSATSNSTANALFGLLAYLGDEDGAAPRCPAEPRAALPVCETFRR